MRLFFQLIIFFLFIPNFVFGVTEQLGTVSLTDVLLKPYLLLKEPQEGEFRLGDSSMQVAWFLDKTFQSRIRLGPESLRNQMARYSDSLQDRIGIVEAFAQYSSVYGQARFGMIPLSYGAEGALEERELFFPRSLFFKNRVFALRDIGFEYRVQNKGYFSEFKVFNGEGETNPDGRMWFIANWGWKDRDKFSAGLAGMTGTTKPSSTAGIADTLAGVDVNQQAKWRMGTVFLKWYPSAWKVLLDFTMGELIQSDDIQGKFAGGHLDFIYDQPTWAVMTRFDYFDPNVEASQDLKRESSIGIILKNHNQTSQVKFIGTKVVEDGNQISNDEFRLVWQLTPLVETQSN